MNMSIEQFMIAFCKLDVNKKMKSIKKLDQAIQAKIGMDGSKLTDGQMRTLKALSRWGGMNILIGDDLVPPTIKQLESYL